jgi:hypothetical protein
MQTCVRPFILSLFISLSLLGVSPTASANSIPEPVLDYIPQAKVQGEGRLRVLFWQVYDAVLYVPETGYQADGTYALSLTYLMDFEGAEIAKRSRSEIADQGFNDDTLLDLWEVQMRDVFPNVKEGDTIIGVRDSDGHARFYHNGAAIGSLKDNQFSNAFFGIWLSPNTSEPKLRKKLLGSPS